MEMNRDSASSSKMQAKTPKMLRNGRASSSLINESLISSPSAKKSFNYKPRLVDRRKMNPDELRQLNLSEIF
jgi:hypothetical protein